MIRVAVAGALGRMGAEVIRAVSAAEDMQVVAGVDVKSGAESQGVAVSANLRQAITAGKPEVLVDFTVAEAAFANAMTALELGVRPVIGTTGMSSDQVSKIEARARETRTGAFIAPNFAIGAVLMMYFATLGSRYFESAE